MEDVDKRYIHRAIKNGGMATCGDITVGGITYDHAKTVAEARVLKWPTQVLCPQCWPEAYCHSGAAGAAVACGAPYDPKTVWFWADASQDLVMHYLLVTGYHLEPCPLCWAWAGTPPLANPTPVPTPRSRRAWRGRFVRETFDWDAYNRGAGLVTWEPIRGRPVPWPDMTKDIQDAFRLKIEDLATPRRTHSFTNPKTVIKTEARYTP